MRCCYSGNLRELGQAGSSGIAEVIPFTHTVRRCAAKLRMSSIGAATAAGRSHCSGKIPDFSISMDGGTSVLFPWDASLSWSLLCKYQREARLLTPVIAITLKTN